MYIYKLHSPFSMWREPKVQILISLSSFSSYTRITQKSKSVYECFIHAKQFFYQRCCLLGLELHVIYNLRTIFMLHDFCSLQKLTHFQFFVACMEKILCV